MTFVVKQNDDVLPCSLGEEVFPRFWKRIVRSITHGSLVKARENSYPQAEFSRELLYLMVINPEWYFLSFQFSLIDIEQEPWMPNTSLDTLF